MRFAAPEHITSITLSSGPLAVGTDGFVDLPDDVSQGDLQGLAANGFTLAPPSPAKPTKFTTSVETADAKTT
jgi:hypothetical protein